MKNYFLCTILTLLAACSLNSAPHYQLGEIPPSMSECEGGQCNGRQGNWTFSGAQGVAAWPMGAKADLTVERFDAGGVVIRRIDRPDSSSPDMTALYTGTLHGNHIDGQVTYSGKGGTAHGAWSATFVRMSCDPSEKISPQEALAAGDAAAKAGRDAPALQCYYIAANAGDAHAKGIVGRMLHDGAGTVPNDALAFSWTKAGAEGGDYDSELSLASMYSRGQGTEANATQAQYWQGKAQSQKQLADAQGAQRAQASQAFQNFMLMGLAAGMIGSSGDGGNGGADETNSYDYYRMKERRESGYVGPGPTPSW